MKIITQIKDIISKKKKNTLKNSQKSKGKDRQHLSQMAKYLNRLFANEEILITINMKKMFNFISHEENTY